MSMCNRQSTKCIGMFLSLGEARHFTLPVQSVALPATETRPAFSRGYALYPDLRCDGRSAFGVVDCPVCGATGRLYTTQPSRGTLVEEWFSAQ